MSQERLSMSLKERDRLLIMQQVELGSIRLVEASERMDVCYRQAKRIWRRWKKGRAGGLIHRSRGRVSNRRIRREDKDKALDLYREHFGDFGPTLASEKLAETFGVSVHAETLRRWLHEAHLLIPRSAVRTHRRRRDRRKHFGELVQMDGSDHDWFEQRGGRACLMVMVDDATGRSLSYMAPAETTQGAFMALKKWIEAHGIPTALYVDKKSVYRPVRSANETERRSGTEALGDFGQACHRLGIGLIFAHSPQAKGRVERKNAVYQDRLVKEMRLRGIDDIDGANAMLNDFDTSLNEKMAIAAGSDVDLHRSTPSARVLNETLCREHSRVVQNDWTVSFEGRIYQIENQPSLPRPKSRVTLRRRLDDSVAILNGESELRYSVKNLQPGQFPHPHGGGGTDRPPALAHTIPQ